MFGDLVLFTKFFIDCTSVVFVAPEVLTELTIIEARLIESETFTVLSSVLSPDPTVVSEILAVETGTGLLIGRTCGLLFSIAADLATLAGVSLEDDPGVDLDDTFFGFVLVAFEGVFVVGVAVDKVSDCFTDVSIGIAVSLIEEFGANIIGQVVAGSILELREVEVFDTSLNSVVRV